MRISPSFGSQSSFEEMDTSGFHILGGTDDALDTDWGVVSTTESDIGNYEQLPNETGTAEHMGDGILILPGLDSGSSNNGQSSDLSVPGTDSLPSEIGSVSADNCEEASANIPHKKRVANKLSIYLIGTGVFLLVSLVAGFVHQHYQYRSTMKQLEEKIQQLEKEKETLRQPPWMDEGDLNNESSLFTLLDNCWIKAKMNVKFGDCSTNSHGLCGAFFENATQSIWKWFDETFPSMSEEGTPAGPTGNTWEDKPSLNDIMETLANFPGIMGEAVASASKAVADKISTLNLGIDEAENPTDDLIRATEAFSEALHAAGDAVASEVQELGADPLKYFTDAVDEAFKPTKSAKVSLDGLRNFAETLSSVSIGWGESMVQVGEAISAKLAGIMSDDSSNFEFKHETVDEMDL